MAGSTREPTILPGPVVDQDADILRALKSFLEQSSPFWNGNTPHATPTLVKSSNFNTGWEALPDDSGSYVDESGHRVSVKRRFADGSLSEVKDAHWAAHNAAKLFLHETQGLVALSIGEEPHSIVWRKMVRHVQHAYQEQIQGLIFQEAMQMKAQADIKTSISPTQHPYLYPGLLKTPFAIRLVVVLPSTEKHSDIICKLCNSTLTTARYEALSYVWGDPSRRKPVLVNDRPFQATENLESALRNLRYPNRHRVVWIDAMCINQNDVIERNAQVQQMGLVYKNAQRVIVWLGPESEDSGDAIDFLRRTPMLDVATTSDKDYREYLVLFSLHLKAVSRLLRRPWFTRVWCVQEFLFGNHVVFQCGSYCLERQELDNTFRFFNNPIGSNSLETIVGEDQSIIDEFILSMKSFLKLNIWKRSQNIEVLPALSEFSEWASSDPRDIVFGVYGLISDDSMGKDALKPDYTLTTAEVYSRVAIYLLQQSRVLDILSLATRPVKGFVKSEKRWLPSWIPDWRDSQRFGVEMFYRSVAFFGVGSHIISDAMYDASLGLQATPIGPYNDNQELYLDGIHVDSIEDIGEPFMESTDSVVRETLLQWKRIAGLPGEYCYQYTGQQVREAFWRTILMDEKHNWFAQVGKGYNGEESKDTLQRARILPDEAKIDYLPQFPPLGIDDLKSIKIAGKLGPILQRRFFKTAKGLFGLAPASARKGDHVVVLFGGKVPFIMRDFGLYQLIGESYVHGIMDGEVIHQPRIERFQDLKVEEFHIG
ncbi:heterokaryon incompatibility protein-domain-containing protein [Nemania abortiva]|nr:heterokaryon incompatibility protein-domain-containing protein [Nemania abortiva]